MTIKQQLDTFEKLAKEKFGNVWIDQDITTWMPNAQVIEGQGGGSITMLDKNTTEKEMLETALKPPLSQAIERMTAELKAGYFSKNLKWLAIYVTDTNSEGVPLLLICDLLDGKLGLYVSKVNPDNTWHVDDDREFGFLSNDSKVLETGHLDTLSLEPLINTKIQDAITLLKSNGFKITKEETIIKEY